MDIESLKSYLQKNNILDNPSIEPIGFGESNINYLAKSKDSQLIIRMAREDVPTEPRFEAEHHFMAFMEACGIEFSPRSVLYDPDNHIHITSFVPGKDASIIDLNDSQINVFVAQLRHLNVIKYDDYLKWCESNKLLVHKPQLVDSRNKINFDDRMNYIRRHDTDPFAKKVLAWAEPKFDRFNESSKSFTPKIRFYHGDLRWNKGGGNLRVDTNDITFIDWELSRFAEGFAEIGDVLGSIPTDKNSRKIMRKLYDAYLEPEKDLSIIKNEIEHGILWGKLGNTLWAIERYYLMKNKNQVGIERYKALAEKGMGDADYYFASKFETWF